MNTTALDSGFQLAREIEGSRVLTTPLERVPSHRVMRARYAVDARHWGPCRLNDPAAALLRRHPEYPDLVCVVGDQVERHVDDLLIFSRTYASIPASWAQVSSAVLRLPGFNQAPTYAAAKTITAVSTRNFGNIFRLSISAHGYSAGDNIHVQLVLEVPGGEGRGQNLAGSKPPVPVRQGWNQSATIRAVTTDTLDIALSPYQLTTRPAFAATIITGSVRKITAGFEKRTVTTRAVTTTIRRDYFLPGVTAAVPIAGLIPLSTPFAIEQGTETDENFQDNTLTGSTIPTATQYRAMIDSSTQLVLECSLEDYLGPIICRKTVSYLAQ
jgi:hypothetical protein